MRRTAVLMALGALAAVLLVPSSASAWSTSCCMPWGAPYQVVLSPDGKFAYSSSYNITLSMARDPDTGSLTVLDSYDAGGAAMALSPDGSTLYVASSFGPRIVAFARDPGTGLLTIEGTWAGSSNTVYRDLQFSHDGRQLYAADPPRDAVIILDRDPAGQALAYRGEVRSGDPGVEDLQAPASLALSADDRFLYVGVGSSPPGVVTFSRGSDGGLTFAGGSQCDCESGDLALGPDGRHLFGGPINVSATARDPDTGALAEETALGGVPNGGFPSALGDDQLAVTPDGTGLYYADEKGDRLVQLGFGPDGFTTEKIYREGSDGIGLLKARGAVISPDGRNVYVPSGEDRYNHGGRIAVFSRDPSTNRLTFVAVFEGPVFNGRPPGEGGQPKLLINDGDAYTNDPDVEITVQNLTESAAVFGFDVSNDGGFGEGTVNYDVVDPGEPYPWTLATSGPERLPKTVYVKILGTPDPGVITDEIVLDERPPAVDAAKIVARRVRIRAHDRLSGVARMQVTRKRGKPGKWRAYKRKTTVPRGHGKVWVRVRDRAGNRSHWRRAAAGRHR